MTVFGWPLGQFSVIQADLSRTFHLAVDFLGLRRNWSSSQIIDQAPDILEQAPWYCHLGQLKRDITAMADNHRSNLDRLHPHRGHIPTLDIFGPRQIPLIMLWTAPTTGIAMCQSAVVS